MLLEVVQNVDKKARECGKIADELKGLEAKVSSLDRALGDYRRENLFEVGTLRESHTLIKGEINNTVQKINFDIAKKEQLLREEFGDGLVNMSKHVNRKLEMLGDKKGIVVDLLKRIAELEGQLEDRNVQR